MQVCSVLPVCVLARVEETEVRPVRRGIVGVQIWPTPLPCYTLYGLALRAYDDFVWHRILLRLRRVEHAHGQDVRFIGPLVQPVVVQEVERWLLLQRSFCDRRITRFACAMTSEAAIKGKRSNAPGRPSIDKKNRLLNGRPTASRGFASRTSEPIDEREVNVCHAGMAAADATQAQSATNDNMAAVKLQAGARRSAPSE